MPPEPTLSVTPETLYVPVFPKSNVFAEIVPVPVIAFVVLPEPYWNVPSTFSVPLTVKVFKPHPLVKLVAETVVPLAIVSVDLSALPLDVEIVPIVVVPAPENVNVPPDWVKFPSVTAPEIFSVPDSTANDAPDENEMSPVRFRVSLVPRVLFPVPEKLMACAIVALPWSLQKSTFVKFTVASFEPNVAFVGLSVPE